MSRASRPTRRWRGCLLSLGSALLLGALAVAFGMRLVEARLEVPVPPVDELEPLGRVVELVEASPQAAEEPIPEPVPFVTRSRRPPSAERIEQYVAARPKSIVELQQWREEQTLEIPQSVGGGRATLINLNPLVNIWFLLRVEPPAGPDRTYQIENTDPEGQAIRLDAASPTGLVLATSAGELACDLWSTEPTSLALATTQPSPWVPLCERRLYLRNRVQGRRSALEWTTDFLRDNVAGGEKITVFVRQTVYKDAYLVRSEVVSSGGAGLEDAPRSGPPGSPPRPVIAAGAEQSFLVPRELGLSVAGQDEVDRIEVGSWHPVVGQEGIFLSAIEPGLVGGEIVERQRGLANPLDEIELAALVYVVAFDLSTYEVAFAMGTDHPRVDWSQRPPESVRNATLPGPDGIGTIAPLVATGMIAPHLSSRTVATFTGGFKRSHGAFRSSSLALVNSGSHYGFVEAGTLLSKLQPGLATFLVYDDGTLELGTWTESDAIELDRIVSARQNGLPLIEPDPETGEPRVGTYVPRWADGNWSGSVDKRLRTLRAAVCTVSAGEDDYLLYAYFSTATPSAMARVLAAYHCDYAMLTDMNALEHTYLALYRRDGPRLEVEHLIRGMHVLDKEEGKVVAPRFLALPDSRDFFYVMKREDR